MQEFETDALTEQMEELVEQRQWAKLRELLLREGQLHSAAFAQHSHQRMPRADA